MENSSPETVQALCSQISSLFDDSSKPQELRSSRRTLRPKPSRCPPAPQNSGLEIFHENFTASPAKGPLHQKLYQHGNDGTACAK